MATSFDQSNRTAEYARPEPRPERIARAQVDQRADRIKARSAQHFAKHKTLWTQREYGKLLKQEAQHLNHPAPNGVTPDRKGVLMHRAQRVVENRQASRMERIDKARSSTIQKEQAKVRAQSQQRGRGHEGRGSGRGSGLDL